MQDNSLLFAAQPSDYPAPAPAQPDPVFGIMQVPPMDSNDRIAGDLRRLNRDAERALGAVVELLDIRGIFEIGDALEVSMLSYEEGEYVSWDDIGQTYAPRLATPAWAFDLLQEDSIKSQISAILESLAPADLAMSSLILSLLAPTVGWRTDRAVRRDESSALPNQALFRPASGGKIQDRLFFANEYELKVYRFLKSLQAALPQGETIGILPGPGFATRERVFAPDFLVTFQHRAIGLEVDGPTHTSRYANDRSRDELLKDCGIVDVLRIAVEDTASDAAMKSHLDRMMNRLRRKSS